MGLSREGGDGVAIRAGEVRKVYGAKGALAVARALVNRPRVVLADEPTGNLDSQTAQQVMALILDHVREHAATLVLVTHDEELAAGCTDRVVRLVDGRVAAGSI